MLYGQSHPIHLACHQSAVKISGKKKIYHGSVTNINITQLTSNATTAGCMDEGEVTTPPLGGAVDSDLPDATIAQESTLFSKALISKEVDCSSKRSVS